MEPKSKFLSLINQAALVLMIEAAITFFTELSTVDKIDYHAVIRASLAVLIMLRRTYSSNPPLK
jgi:hypothetical protein